MKKILVGMISMAGLVLSAQAQETRVQKQRDGYHQKRMMSAELNLSDAQKEQIKLNQESFKAQLADLEKQETMTVKEYKEKKASLHKEQKEKISNILTAEQKATLAKSSTERKDRHGMRGQNIEQLKTDLNLTEDQLSRLKANRETHMAAAMAIKENTQLSSTEKQEKLKELKEKNKTSLQEILTAEQLQKMKDMKKERTRK